MELHVNKELKNYLPPLDEAEFDKLKQSILADGCREPVRFWFNPEKQRNEIVDGHNRHTICTTSGLGFTTRQMAFDSIEAVKQWMDENQIGRRNLSAADRTLVLGRIYNRMKQTHGGKRDTSGQSDHMKTSDVVAEQYDVSERTVRRAGEYASAYEKAKEVIGEDAAHELHCEKGANVNTMKRLVEDDSVRKKFSEQVDSGVSAKAAFQSAIAPDEPKVVDVSITVEIKGHQIEFTLPEWQALRRKVDTEFKKV